MDRTELEKFARPFASQWIAENVPMISGGLTVFQEALADDDREIIDDVFWRFIQNHEDPRAALAGGLESFSTISVDFLRLQGRFMRSGKYRAAANPETLQELYADGERMRGYYLDGLFLTYALWPNHVQMLKFFRDRFLARLPENVSLLEVGVGHGLMASLMLEQLPGSSYHGIDISSHSIDYAMENFSPALKQAGRVKMSCADITDPALKPGHHDAVVCCEVLEHVLEPDVLLEALSRSVEAGSFGFLTTVANMEAEDHVYLFHDADDIRTHITRGGFEIVEDQANGLPGMEDATPRPLNYSAIVQRT